jgi:hypothetical protein
VRDRVRTLRGVSPGDAAVRSGRRSILLGSVPRSLALTVGFGWLSACVSGADKPLPPVVDDVVDTDPAADTDPDTDPATTDSDGEDSDTTASDTDSGVLDSDVVDTDSGVLDTDTTVTDTDTGVVDTDVADTDLIDTDVVDTDVADTDVVDTDVVDTDVADTDVVDTDLVDTDVVDTGSPDTDVVDTDGPLGASVVFVLAFENHDTTQIYGNLTNAPYINLTLLPLGGIADAYVDDLQPATPSEPHYVWMEAGTNVFADVTFSQNLLPSASNSTASTDHLVSQIGAVPGLSWMSYQEGINASTGACPIYPFGFYAPRHDPFVFFKDVAGDPPDANNAFCAAHHKPYTALAADLAAETVATYNFITPDLCNDMHGASGCPGPVDDVRKGDDWLAANLPPILDYANTHDGVVMLVWDEPDWAGHIPFVILGPRIKAGHVSSVPYSHSSLLKSTERLLGLPVLPTVQAAHDFADFFVTP